MLKKKEEETNKKHYHANNMYQKVAPVEIYVKEKRRRNKQKALSC